MRARFEFPGATWALLALLLSGCGGEKGDPRLVPLQKIQAAAESRDADGVAAWLDPSYRDVEGQGPNEVREALKRWFLAYQDLKLTVSEVKVEDAPEGAARATFRAAFSGTPRQVGGLAGLLPSSSAYRFEVRLVPAPGGAGWRISWASWRQDG